MVVSVAVGNSAKASLAVKWARMFFVLVAPAVKIAWRSAREQRRDVAVYVGVSAVVPFSVSRRLSPSLLRKKAEPQLSVTGELTE